MAGMEIDSPYERDSSFTPRDRIVQRLVMHGIPQGYLQQFQVGLVAFVRDNKCMIPEIVPSILPTDLDLSESQMVPKTELAGVYENFSIKELFEESILWLQWLMFDSDPHESMSSLAQSGDGQRAVCGAVWGHNDLAYRCRTCEQDPTCAICVPCFQNGNHKDHDYSSMYTGGGCCDCGDETAWKKEGFCSEHKGTEQIRPLSLELANSVGPVLDSLLSCWKDKVMSVEHKHVKDADYGDTYRKAADGISTAIIQMLLDFCICSESLLSFISRRLAACSGLLDVLLKAEKLLDKEVVKRLHELLLKLLGDPLFKYDFAKIFIQYYPTNVKEMIKDSSDSYLERYPMLATFSVQIFTVPTLTLRLVTEVDLLAVLLACLKDLFLSCVDADGHLQASKWVNLYDATIRLIEDLRYVISHKEVPTYVARERPDISKNWIFLLRLVQGMDAQKRVTGLHTEEENENLSAPFVLGQYLGNVNALLVGGTFSVDTNVYLDKHGPDDIDRQRHAKVGRVSQESSASRTGALDTSQFIEAHFNWENGICLPSSAVWLISECLKAIECWLRSEIESLSYSSSSGVAITSASNILALRKKLFRARKGPNTIRFNGTSMTRMDMDREAPVTGDSNARFLGMDGTPEAERGCVSHSNDSLCIGVTNELYPEHSYSTRVSDDTLMDVEYSRESAAFSILKLTNWPAINCDVSSQAISFHIPLHRLLSVLLRKALKSYCHVIGQPDKTNGTTTTSNFIHHQDFFRKALVGLHPCGFSAFIMEHPLQLRVFCAQVRAGMWRKNGDAAILSSEWYRSVLWLEQGLESDLFLLQCCAALASPDSFVQRVLERYGLLNYMSLNLADYNEFEPVLVQEMLTLIIHIVKERRFCGSSTTENLRRELVYRLVIGDATHSQLVKSLPRDLSKSDKLQNAVDMLAVYCNPSGMKQGKYSLRKAYWKELDLYHPRWSSRDLQVAEERYFRFCRVSALNAQLPRWTPIFDPLASICRIATSKMVLQIVRVVFFYAYFSERSSISRAPDAVVITALHLVSLALDICEAQQLSHTDDSLPIITFASEEFDAGSTSASVFWKNQSMLSLLVALMRKYKEQNDDIYAETRQCNISSLIEDLLKKFANLSANCMAELKLLAHDVVCSVPQVNSTMQNVTSTSDVDERKVKARQRQAAILAKMRAEQSKFIESLSSNNIEQESYKLKDSLPKVDDVKEESVPVCSLCHDPDSGSTLCFLILLQKSRLASFVDRGPPAWENAEQSYKVGLAGKPKLTDSSGLDTSSPLQLVQTAGPDSDYDVEPVDVDTFLDFIRDRVPDIRNFQLPKVSHDADRDSSFCFDLMEDNLLRSIIADIYETQSYSHFASGEQICSTSIAVDSNISKDSGSLLREYVACLSRKSSKQHNSSFYDILHLGNLKSKSNGTIARVSRFGPKDCDGIHISSCGHAVHQECHERYLASLKQRNIRRLGLEGGHIIDPDLGELLCPVCRRFANSVLPAVPSTADKSGKHVEVSARIAESSNIFQIPLALSLLQSADKMVRHGRFLKMSSGKLKESIEPALEPTLHKLCMLYYPHNYNDLSASGRLSQSLVMWDTLRYSLISTEVAARGRVEASSANSSLEALYGELHSSSGFILSLILHAAKRTCSSSSIEVLCRFRGIQLLTRSICFGMSEDNTLSSSDKRRGSLILEHTESGELFPDIQFWKRSADPILAHDPFSSLMWVLFCLPSSFMQSSEFFIPLMHLFYAVSVIQSLIACYSKDFFDASNFSDSLLSDLCKVMGESSPLKKYFVLNYIDPSCHPKDMIRRLTFPFLRRCALLWKLLQSTTTAPLFDCSNVWEGLNPHAKTDALELDSANYFRMELDGIRELEDLFHVSSLELVLNDEVVHSLALKWCEHFCDELKANKCGGMLYYTPAVPFKLMQLPRVYQDLLQRYVKLKCPECKSVPEEPALCLLCGKLCSPSWKSCCRASKCLNHANSCGAGIGVFLLVRKTTILLQRSSRQAFWPSPYLDAFGEEDIDMYRGKPLFLNVERYAALTYLVASHGLDRTSEVLRQTTISVYGSD